MLKRTSLSSVVTSLVATSLVATSLVVVALLISLLFVFTGQALAVQWGYYSSNNSAFTRVSPSQPYSNTYSWGNASNRSTYVVYGNPYGNSYGSSYSNSYSTYTGYQRPAYYTITPVTKPATPVTTPVTTPPPSGQTAVPQATVSPGTGPAIEGSATFQQRVNAALDLLRSRAPASWEIVRNNLRRIRESTASAALVWEGTFLVGPTTAASDSLWFASTIVHDSYHVQQYREGRPFVGEGAEREALGKQREALVQMGAPGYMISHVDSVASTRYWETSFNNRPW